MEDLYIHEDQEDSGAEEELLQKETDESSLDEAASRAYNDMLDAEMTMGSTLLVSVKRTDMLAFLISGKEDGRLLFKNKKKKKEKYQSHK